MHAKRILRATVVARGVRPSLLILILATMLAGTVDWGSAFAQNTSQQPAATEVPGQENDLPPDPNPQSTESPNESPEQLVATETSTEQPAQTEVPTEQPAATEVPAEELPATEVVTDPPVTPDVTEEPGPIIVGPTTAPSDATGTVHVIAYTCPAGYDTAGVGFALLEEECRADAELTSFTVSNADGYSSTQSARLTRPPFMQQADFDNVPAGAISITETILPGYGAPIVYCAVDARVVADWILQSVSGGNSISWNLATGTAVDCFFFNISIPETPTPEITPEAANQMTVTTYDCPAGTSRELGLPDLGTTCELMPDVSFAIVYGDSGAYGTSDSMGTFAWLGLPAGPWTVTEPLPEGYGDPVVFCGPAGETETPRLSAPGGVFTGAFTATNEHVICSVFNIPNDAAGGTITVTKYTCPAGTERSDVAYTLSEQCTEAVAPVTFLLLASDTYAETRTTSAGVPQHAEFTNVPYGQVGIVEAIPEGYGEPLAFCADTPADGAGAYLPIPISHGDTAIVQHRAEAELPLACLFFNFEENDGTSLSVIIHTCSPGYDLVEAGADPFVDCPTLTDGVTVTLTGPATDTSAVSGDAGTGMVQFLGLAPGDYVLTQAVPAGIDSSFVAECFGNESGAVRPYPLATGDTLNLTIHDGEEISCHWFNVPDHDNTSLTIQKYTCASETFVDMVDCQVFEHGKTFDLVFWNGESWEIVATATTDGFGRATFGPLEPGDYWLAEHDGEWCHLASDQLADDGTRLSVAHDNETRVDVFNCDATPGNPGETPTKFPDTGVPTANRNTRWSQQAAA